MSGERPILREATQIHCRCRHRTGQVVHAAHRHHEHPLPEQSGRWTQPGLGGRRPPAVQGYSYVGCFVDSGNRDIAQASGVSLSEALFSDARVMQCANACDGYTYMGLQWVNECFCDNDYGDQGEAAIGDCDTSGTVDDDAGAGAPFWLHPAQQAFELSHGRGLHVGTNMRKKCGRQRECRTVPIDILARFARGHLSALFDAINVIGELFTL